MRLIDTYLLTLYIVYRGRRKTTHFVNTLFDQYVFHSEHLKLGQALRVEAHLNPSNQPGIHTPSIFAL